MTGRHAKRVEALSLRHAIRMQQARQAGTLLGLSRSGVVDIPDDTDPQDAAVRVAQVGTQVHDAVIQAAGDAQLTPVMMLRLHGEKAVEWLDAGDPDLVLAGASWAEMRQALLERPRSVLVAATVLVDTRQMPKPARQRA